MKHLRTQLLLFLSILLAASACNQQSQEEESSNNDNEEIVFEFEEDEIRNFQLTDERIQNFISLQKEAGIYNKNFEVSAEVYTALLKNLNKYGLKDLREFVIFHDKITAGVMLMQFEDMDKKVAPDRQLTRKEKKAFRELIEETKDVKTWGEVVKAMRQYVDQYISKEDIEVLRRNYPLLKKEEWRFI